MIKLSSIEVERIRTQRLERDLKVAGDLWDLFEKEQRVGMMQCIRTLVGHGLDYLYELKWKDKEQMEAFLDKECGGLDLWEGKHQTFDRFIKLRERGSSWWDIGKCGGFFRMYGTFFEFFSDPKYAEAGLKKIYDEGVDSFKKHTMPKGNGFAFPFGKYKSGAEKGKMPQEVEKYRKENPRARDMHKQPTKVPKAVEGLVRRDYGEDPGITLFKLLEWSTIKKIDFLYGLPEGADISGTTCDHLFGIYHTIYLMESGRSAPRSIKFTGGSRPADLEEIHKRKPLIILLPLAQMVREYHHALLETAAALSLNDFIDYKIGFYSSLLAKDYTHSYDKMGKKQIKVVPWRPMGMPIADTVRKLFEDADKETTQMVCYSTQNGAAGYAMDKTKQDEVRKFEAFSRLGVETYQKFYELPKASQIAEGYLKLMLQKAGLKP